jgi:hypothetical protein
MKRRSIIKRTGGIAGGILGIGPVSGSVRSVNNKVCIPSHLSNGESIRYMKVNANWWNYSQRVNKVREQVVNLFLGDEDVQKIEETARDEELGNTGMRTADITVYGAPESSLGDIQSKVPEEVDGVPINVDKYPGSIDTAYKKDYDPITGGVVGNDGSNSTFTICCRVDYSDYLRMLYPRHPFSADKDYSGSDGIPGRCETGDVDRAAYQNDDYVGNTDNDWQKHDIAVVGLDLEGERSGVDNTIVEQVGSIEGVISSSRLDYIKDNRFDSPIKKRGIATGKREGNILGTHGTKDCSNSGASDMQEILRTSNLQKSGDSGGPRYEVLQSSTTDYDLYIAGPATQANFNSESNGVAAWYINQETGIIFDT